MQTDLTELESQVDNLMRTIDVLQFENAALKQKIAVHIKGHASAQHKNQRVAKQIRQLIKQMKEELA